MLPDHTLPREPAFKRINDAIHQSAARLKMQASRPMHQQGLTLYEHRFLLSRVAAEPDWSLLGVPHFEQLPGLKWKLQNLERLRKSNAKKLAEQSDALERHLDS